MNSNINPEVFRNLSGSVPSCSKTFVKFLGNPTDFSIPSECCVPILCLCVCLLYVWVVAGSWLAVNIILQNGVLCGVDMESMMRVKWCEVHCTHHPVFYPLDGYCNSHFPSFYDECCKKRKKKKKIISVVLWTVPLYLLTKSKLHNQVTETFGLTW